MGQVASMKPGKWTRKDPKKNKCRLPRNAAKSPPELRNKVYQLLMSGGLSQCEAGNVLSQDVPLDKVLLRRAVRKVMTENRFRSILDDAANSKGYIAICLVHADTMFGKIIGISPFQIAFEPAMNAGATMKAPVFMIDKVRITHAYHPALQKTVASKRLLNKDIKNKKYQIPALARHRLRFRHEALQRYLWDSTRLKFALFDGHILEGVIRWWSQYEIGVDVGNNVVVTLFRHAILGMCEVDGDTAYVWDEFAASEQHPSTARSSDPVNQTTPDTEMKAVALKTEISSIEQSLPTTKRDNEIVVELSEPILAEPPAYDPTSDLTKSQATIWRIISSLERPWKIKDIIKKSRVSPLTVNSLFTDLLL